MGRHWQRINYGRGKSGTVPYLSAPDCRHSDAGRYFLTGAFISAQALVN